MKRKSLVLAVVLLLVFSTVFMSSCELLGDGTSLSTGNTTINVEAGDNYDITITPSAQPNILAASKAVLSAVSVYCGFTRNTYGWGGIMGSEEVMSSGSGVIYKLDKEKGEAYIITNYHVVYDANCNTKNRISDDIKVYLYGKEATKYAISAEYVGGSMKYDLAVLKVKASQVIMESPSMAAMVADSDEVSILETAIAIGNPEGIGLSATLGYVNVDSEYISISMVNYTNGKQEEIELRCLRIDAAVNSGNSGGGLFNANGELIGIVNAKLSDESVDNIGYAIPSNVAKAVADNIIYHCDTTSNESVFRYLLGVTVGTTETWIEYDKNTGKVRKFEKVVVTGITEGGAVDGLLEEYDVINSITIDGVRHDVTRMYHVVDSMLNARIGSRVVINVTRGGESVDVEVEIVESMQTPY